jgi:hypothetical protein
MKQKDILLLVVVGFLTALFSFMLTGAIFKTPVNRSTKVPVAGSVSTTFPDIKNDPSYNTIFNSKALDPAVPLQVGANPNDQPFNGSSQ